ncbi:MAG TPA: hypothetical protein H9829_07535 [Candidatus Tetragenococcus pullicola]|nr:hypothetical protein [Candidatus Tetragenococcus pullicola]
MKTDTLENILIICVLLFILNTYIGLWIFPILIGVSLELLLVLTVAASLAINHYRKPKIL